MTPEDPVALVLTALPVEMAAVLAHLAGDRSSTLAGPVLCEIGQFTASGERPWQVVAAELGPGVVDTAGAVVAMAAQFQPDVLMFAGIAGSLTDQVTIGDVVAGTEVVWTERGKWTPGGYQVRIRTISLSPILVQLARKIAREGTWASRLTRPRPGTKAIVAQIASGEKVIADEEYRTWLRATFSDAAAIENEGFALARTGEVHAKGHRYVVRGISDNADGAKSDRGHADAADAAAAFTFTLLDAYTAQVLRRQATHSAGWLSSPSGALLDRRRRADVLPGKRPGPGAATNACSVSASGGADYRTISEAISAAQPWSRIVVRPGVYRESLELKAPVIITGEGSRQNVILMPASNSCVQSGVGGIVRGITLRADSNATEPTVRVTGGEFELQDCDIAGTNLGAIYIEDGIVTIQGCRVQGVRPSGRGLWLSDGKVDVSECEFIGGGTAVEIGRGHCTLESCHIHDHWIGVYIHDHGNTLVTGCVIEDGRWGANVGRGYLVMRNCKIRGHTYWGVAMEREAEGRLQGNEFTNNRGGSMVSRAPRSRIQASGNVGEIIWEGTG